VTAITGGTLLIVVSGALLTWHAAHAVNRTTMATSPRPVTFALAEASTFRPSRSYVGSIEPWVEANVGPQYISAYVETVLVRPGDPIAHGAVVATLDCANPNAATRAAEMQAHAIETTQRALADEAARVHSLLDGGFVPVNETEKREAASEAERSQAMAAQARVTAAALDVKDCVLRAPFDGEIARRSLDPGAFVHPGDAIVSVVDRNTVRVVADAPEKDFDVVAPATAVAIDVLSTGAHVTAVVSRRTPKADASTRTVHFEIDVSDSARAIPVSTTGLVHIEVGTPKPATKIPVYAAKVNGTRANVFVIDGDIAREKVVTVLGEAGDSIFVDPTELASGAHVVAFGRALLHDGDRVAPKPDTPPPARKGDGANRGGGSGRPM
jgi:RND family efflux transporter MFP subunit